MGKIFYIMGKSASGKDTIYRRLLEDPTLDLKTVLLYTTRPMRSEETEGIQYHFVSEEQLDEILKYRRNSVIEMRTYQTVHGPWTYFTLDDGQFDLEHQNMVMVGTLESYHAMKAHFPDGTLIPLYIEVENSVRRERAMQRENAQSNPKFEELERRFRADEEDFSEEKLIAEGIHRRYSNIVLESCLDEIIQDIHRYSDHVSGKD